jgi:putative peptide zinc metalloprotease protein
MGAQWGGPRATPLVLSDRSSTASRDPSSITPGAVGPLLLPGTELIGPGRGFGLREEQFLARRRDGQVVALSRLLYAIASMMDGRSAIGIADRVATELGIQLSEEDVRYVTDTKLAPLGLVAYSDGTVSELRRREVMLALRLRVGVLPEGAVNALAGVLAALFAPVVAVTALAGLVASDVWLATSHGTADATRALLRHPALGLALFASVLVSLAFHELGHAAACRYGGARPGRIGVGIYLVWPVFYTDVTDSWRLSRRGRLRCDLGGVYFNALFALGAVVACLLTGYRPLLLIVLTQQVLILDQFLPWARLDGYHVISDLIGVPDLFARIGPVIRCAFGARRGAPAGDLKRSARVAVRAWVATTMLVLLALVSWIALNATSYLQWVWRSLFAQLTAVRHGGDVVIVLSGLIGSLTVLLPVIGLATPYFLTCRRLGKRLAARSVRRRRA